MCSWPRRNFEEGDFGPLPPLVCVEERPSSTVRWQVWGHLGARHPGSTHRQRPPLRTEDSWQGLGHVPAPHGREAGKHVSGSIAKNFPQHLRGEQPKRSYSKIAAVTSTKMRTEPWRCSATLSSPTHPLGPAGGRGGWWHGPACAWMLAAIVPHTAVGELVWDTGCDGERRAPGFWERGFPGAAASPGLIWLSPPLSRFRSCFGRLGFQMLWTEKAPGCQPLVGISTGCAS